jgi:hypothetical protein
MGRVWNFFNQDANAAIDPMARRYLRFWLSHRVLLYAGNVGLLLLIWFFLSKPVALISLGIWVALMLHAIAAALRNHKSR